MSSVQPFLLTKIIATIGPVSGNTEAIVRLIQEGARVFRINFSHGSFEGFAGLLGAIRAASEETGVPVGALGDISGPKIRVGKVRDGGIRLEPGMVVEFQRPAITATVGDSQASPVVFSTTYPDLIADAEPGQRLLIDDGTVRLIVTDKAGAGDAERLVARVTVGGLVTSAKGINLPDTHVTAPSLTEHDLRCVDWALDHGVDFLALSFVRRAMDIYTLKDHIARRLEPGSLVPPVIAKIEKPQALDELEPIVQATDGLMVARGDLGVEMPLEQVPVIQKRIIALAHDYGKPVIVATQMLQSMIDLPSPTRAEVSDVANAIYDGADAVMLSGETAVGKYPQQAVEVMGRIARSTQQAIAELKARPDLPPRKLQENQNRTAALAHGVNVVVRDLKSKLIGVWSQRGGGAQYLSQNRPIIPIIAASSDPAVLRKMSLMFAVTPVLMERPDHVEDFANKLEQVLLHRGWAEHGDPIVLVAGEPIGISGVTNTVLVRNLGRVCRIEHGRVVAEEAAGVGD